MAVGLLVGMAEGGLVVGDAVEGTAVGTLVVGAEVGIKLAIFRLTVQFSTVFRAGLFSHNFFPGF